MTMLQDGAAIHIYGLDDNGPVTCLWGEFKRDNGDGFSDADYAAVAAALATGKTWAEGGGGAPYVCLALAANAAACAEARGRVERAARAGQPADRTLSVPGRDLVAKWDAAEECWRVWVNSSFADSLHLSGDCNATAEELTAQAVAGLAEEED